LSVKTEDCCSVLLNFLGSYPTAKALRIDSGGLIMALCNSAWILFTYVSHSEGFTTCLSMFLPFRYGLVVELLFDTFRGVSRMLAMSISVKWITDWLSVSQVRVRACRASLFASRHDHTQQYWGYQRKPFRYIFHRACSPHWLRAFPFSLSSCCL
jgi:hypothetical protein